MRSVSVSVVKNEADVIEAMVRHNLQYLDHMTFIDNGSIDGTFEILTALRDEGLPIDLRQDASAGHLQTTFINRFVNGPDCDRSGFVFFLDGDEFLSSDADLFREFLDARPGSFRISWKTYVPTPRDNPRDPNVVTRITMARLREPSVNDAKAVLSPVDQGPVMVKHGNHGLRGVTLASHPVIRLAHFPVRSARQIACKALLGAWNVELRGRVGLEATQWFQIAETIRKEGLPSAAALRAIGASYRSRRPIALSADPLKSPVPFDLRYGGLAKDPLLSGMIDFVDRLVLRIRSDAVPAL